MSQKHDIRRQILPYSLVAILFLLVSFTFGRTKLYGDGMFWDGRVYAQALTAWHAGGNPYAIDGRSLLFVSPPIFLKIAGLLSAVFVAHTGWYLYIALVVASAVSIPYLLARFYIVREWMTPFIAMLLYATQPHFIVERSMISGNIGLPSYALALLAGIPGIRRNRWLWFYVVVIAASLVKPAFLAMLLLPVMAGKRQYWQSAVTTLVVFAVYGLQRLTMPGLYKAFQAAAYQQIVVKHDVGVGTYDGFYHLSGRVHLFRSLTVDSLVHFAFLAVLIGGLFLLRRQREHPLVGRLWVPALLVAAIVANPRMQDYDTNVAILPALYICLECIRYACRHWTGVAVVAFAANLVIVVFTRNYEIGLNLLLFGAVVLTLAYALSAARSPATAQDAQTEEEINYFEERQAS